LGRGARQSGAQVQVAPGRDRDRAHVRPARRQSVCEAHDAGGTLRAREESIPGSGGGSDREEALAGGREAGQAGCEAEAGRTGDVAEAASDHQPISSSFNQRFADFTLMWIDSEWPNR